MKLLVATPCAGRMIHMSYVSSLVGLIQYLEMMKIDFQTMFQSSADVRKTRSDYVNYALHQGFTHILFIDADMGFEWSDFELLLKSGKDIISGMCPKKKYPIEYVQGPAEGTPDHNGALEVEWASTAFCLINLEVFRGKEHATTKCKSVSSVTLEPIEAPDWFPAGSDFNGIYHSEDRAFFKLMRHIGEPVFVHTKALITHSGIHVYKGEGK